MPNDPEKELQEFLASKPEWVQTYFQEGISKLTLKEKSESIDKHEWLSGLTEQYEQILCRIPGRWKQYRAKIMREYGNTFGRLLLPKAVPGRKENIKLAERIWALDAAGKKNHEIQETLNANGENLSLEAVESYLKKRRRIHKQ